MCSSQQLQWVKHGAGNWDAWVLDWAFFFCDFASSWLFLIHNLRKRSYCHFNCDFLMTVSLVPGFKTSMTLEEAFWHFCREGLAVDLAGKGPGAGREWVAGAQSLSALCLCFLCFPPLLPWWFLSSDRTLPAPSLFFSLQCSDCCVPAKEFSEFASERNVL